VNLTIPITRPELTHIGLRNTRRAGGRHRLLLTGGSGRHSWLRVAGQEV
jgi:hypothetical protein